MAKKKEFNSGSSAREVFYVNSDEHDLTSIQEAVRQGKRIKWSSVDKFFELPESLIRELDQDSKTEYFVTKSLYDQGKKSPGKGYYGELEVIELIPSNALTRFTFEAPPDVHMFFPTIEQARAAELAGYKYVSRSSSKFKQIIRSEATSEGDPDKVYIHNPTTGKPEHVAMYIPKERYEKHIHALAEQSHRRIQASEEDMEFMKKQISSRAGVSEHVFDTLEPQSKTVYEKEELTQVYEKEKEG